MRAIRKLAAGLALVGGLLIVLCAFLITIDVITRLFFGQIYLNSFELSRLLFAVAVGLSLAYAAVERAHIRIDLAIQGRSAPIRAAVGILAYFALALVGAYLAVRGADLFMHSWRTNARPVANVPIRLWVPQGAWLLGLIAFATVSLLVALAALRHALARRWHQAEALVGTPSVGEEIDSATPAS
jgi:TRAP-type C4-dicarboxylate transport system permease small subunit